MVLLCQNFMNGEELPWWGECVWESRYVLPVGTPSLVYFVKTIHHRQTNSSIVYRRTVVGHTFGFLQERRRRISRWRSSGETRRRRSGRRCRCRCRRHAAPTARWPVATGAGHVRLHVVQHVDHTWRKKKTHIRVTQRDWRVNQVNWPIVGIAVPKSFCERIAGYFQLGDAVVLVGRDGGEFRLREDERAKVFRLRRVFCPLVDVNNVETRLVAMHGIQYDLCKSKWMMRRGEKMSKRCTKKKKKKNVMLHAIWNKSHKRVDGHLMTLAAVRS